jgi:hypothetical protein
MRGSSGSIKLLEKEFRVLSRRQGGMFCLRDVMHLVAGLYLMSGDDVDPVCRRHSLSIPNR